MTAAHPIPDAALESDIAILGKKGRGKSFTARGLVERLLDKGRRVIVLDPLSTWWGLKAGPNAYPIPVIGGPQADLPLVDTDGEQLGRYLATADQSAVIDLGAFRKAELVRFATPFLEELYTHNRDPLWLVLEEADVFAPQQPMPDTARMLGEVDRIARRGRQFGFKLISLTQRPARLNKDVLTQLSTLIALGITSPQDRDAIKAWVEGAGDRDKAKEVLGTLASLKVGEGWVWAPDHDILERVTFPPIKTLDTSATPKAGEVRKVAKIRKDVDVEALRSAMIISSPSNEAAKNNMPGTPPNGAELVTAERRGFERGFQAGAIVGARQGWSKAMGEAREEISGLLGKLEQRRSLDLDSASVIVRVAAVDHVMRSRSGSAAEEIAKPDPKYAENYASPRSTSASAVVAPGNVVLNSAGRKLLAVLDTNPPVRRSWQQVATLAGLKARGGHFNAGRKAIINAGLVVDDGSLIAIAAPSSGAGAAATDAAALVERWCQVLKGAAPKILRALAQRKTGLRRSAIADLLGMQPRGGHWNAAWKELRDNGIVSFDTNDVARLSELFRAKEDAS